MPGDHVIDGKSWMTLLKDTNAPGHDTLNWVWKEKYAIRQGKWKLVRNATATRSMSKRQRPTKGDRVFLADLEVDPGETTNLLDQHPDIAERSTQTPQRLASRYPGPRRGWQRQRNQEGQAASRAHSGRPPSRPFSQLRRPERGESTSRPPPADLAIQNRGKPANASGWGEVRFTLQGPACQTRAPDAGLSRWL